jgi:hypothetical protein
LSAALDRAPAVVVYIVRRGWHIDIGFAAADLSTGLAALRGNFPEARYLLFGFGDRRYLMAQNRHGPELLEALWPGAGLLLVTGLRATPADAFGSDNVLTVPLDREQSLAVQAFVTNSLSHAALTGQSDAPGPYEGGLYFGATQAYSAWHTCNTWVAEALRAAPMPLRSRGVVFASQLWAEVRDLPRTESGPAPQAGGLP